MQAAQQNIWPGMTLATSVQFTRVGRGLPISKPSQFAQVHVRYYHQVDYGTGGHTSLTFFNAGAQDHVSNVNNGTIPDERPFWLTGVCISWQDLTAAGARSGVQIASGNINAYARAEEVRTILNAGLFNLTVGDRKIIEAQDLTHFPADGGFHVGGVSISHAAATASAAVPFNNGAPIAGNRFRLPAPYPILPGKPIRGLITWPQALSVTVAGRLRVELVGESIMPLNA